MITDGRDLLVESEDETYYTSGGWRLLLGRRAHNNSWKEVKILIHKS